MFQETRKIVRTASEYLTGGSFTKDSANGDTGSHMGTCAAHMAGSGEPHSMWRSGCSLEEHHRPQ